MDDQKTPSESNRLGDMLKQARASRNLELSDVASVTHVRKEYLIALDEGRYADLPEDVYARNFLKLYAQAVGLDQSKALEAYARERNNTSNSTTSNATSAQTASSSRRQTARKVNTPSANVVNRQANDDDDYTVIPDNTRARRPGRPARASVWLMNTLVVVLLVAAAVWAFNTFMFNPPRRASVLNQSQQQTQPEQTNTDTVAPLTDNSSNATTTTDTAPVTPQEVTLSVITDPPGAEVTIDNYPFPTSTPITNAPVTAGDERLLRVNLPGYEPVEQAINLNSSQALSFVLVPVSDAPAPDAVTTSEAGAVAAEGTAPASQQGEIAISIEAETWLEVYAGTARGQGERLVYTSAQEGASYTFPLPVFLHVGNAGGVRLSVDGQSLGLMGSSGEVVSRAFTQ